LDLKQLKLRDSKKHLKHQAQTNFEKVKLHNSS